MEVDQFLTHSCLKATSIVLAGSFCFLAISFLSLSYQAADSEVFRLMGHQVTGYNSKYEHKHAYMINSHLETQA